MDRARLRTLSYVCRSCRSRGAQPLALRLPSDTRCSSSSVNAARRNPQSTLFRKPATTSPHIKSSATPLPTRCCQLRNLTLEHGSTEDMESRVEKLIAADRVPTDDEVVELLVDVEAQARKIVGIPDSEAAGEKGDSKSPTSAILSMRSQFSKDTSFVRRTSADLIASIDALSDLARTFLLHPNVFISLDAMQTYVILQVNLCRPDSLPELLDLFANKPAPVPPKKGNGSPTYKPAKGKSVAAAIPPAIADIAIDSAIATRDLSLTLSVIETSYRAPAYRRLKIFKQALVPMIGAALTPAAAYTLASNLANTQNGLPPETFTQLAFTGLGAYTVCVGTVGFVALTSANDQMQRVTWAIGTPLWERWVREEERAAVERVALAWGFKEKRRWGEEDGEAWENLREWIGMRGMVLDKIGLMEGME